MPGLWRSTQVDAMDALQYVKTLRLAPSGQKLDGTEKLALALIATELDESGQAEPHIDRLAEACLVTRRSMFRILANLESKRALLSLPQTTPQGQSAPTKYSILDERGRVLPASPYLAGRVLSVTREGVTRGASIAQTRATGDTLPPQANSSSSNGLQPATSGTGLAIPNNPNSLDSRSTGESVTGVTLRDNEAVKAWFEIVGTPTSTYLAPAQMQMIAERVRNLPAWRYTLEGWVNNPRWRADNVTGQVERYETKALCLPQFQKPEAPKQTTPPEDVGRYGNLMYGEQD